eukprot:CAMPEP_0194340572 /NCGR_PEP_ID=MMETSP0171-20130528/86826_1 /TAXON_ID=218684 /ORGANISM="Corethron pennatum, Strain L29A3" /LENGTH=179 /DNA_ID=CAMNT_0039105571 /DNA_START=32 /DNA_END=568 /DNA_ORIENTATION=+
MSNSSGATLSFSENEAIAIVHWIASPSSPDLSNVIGLSTLQQSLGMTAPLVFLANVSFKFRTPSDGYIPTEEECNLFGRLQEHYHAGAKKGASSAAAAQRIFLLSPRMRAVDKSSLAAMASLARRAAGEIAEHTEREIRDDLEREERAAERKNRKKMKRKMQRRRKTIKVPSENFAEGG